MASDARSLPAPGSLNSWHQISSALRIAGRYRSFCSSVAWGRGWQARLAEGRWVGIHWPRAYGGRGASPLEVAIFNTEYARARAPQPVNRVGINLTGPTPPRRRPT